MDIVGKRYWFFGLSLLVIIPGLLALIFWGFSLAIDFTGGSLLQIEFEPGKAPAPAEVVALYTSHEIGDAVVQSSGESALLIRSKAIDEATKGDLVRQLESQTGSSISILRFESVGPSVGSEVARRAAGAV